MDYQGLQLREVSRSSLADYAELLSSSFAGFQPSVEYLNWLYFENPRGQVRGFDAFDGEGLLHITLAYQSKLMGLSMTVCFR